MSSLTDVDIVLMRMTIIGVLLSFRALAQEALNDVSIHVLIIHRVISPEGRPGMSDVSPLS